MTNLNNFLTSQAIKATARNFKKTGNQLFIQMIGLKSENEVKITIREINLNKTATLVLSQTEMDDYLNNARKPFWRIIDPAIKTMLSEITISKVPAQKFSAVELAEAANAAFEAEQEAKYPKEKTLDGDFEVVKDVAPKVTPEKQLPTPTPTPVPTLTTKVEEMSDEEWMPLEANIVRLVKEDLVLKSMYEDYAEGGATTEMDMKNYLESKAPSVPTMTEEEVIDEIRSLCDSEFVRVIVNGKNIKIDSTKDSILGFARKLAAPFDLKITTLSSMITNNNNRSSAISSFGDLFGSEAPF